MGDVLQQHGLAGPRRRDDQRPLPLPDRRHQVDDPRAAIPDRGILDLHRHPFIGIERGQVVEGDLVAGFLGILEVDPLDPGQREIPLVLARGPNDALDAVAGPQGMLPDHVGADINVVGPGQVIGFGRTQKAETVLHDLQHPLAADIPTFFGMFLEDREHHLALAHGRGVLDFPFLGHGQQVGRAFRLEFGQVQALIAHIVTVGRPRVEGRSCHIRVGIPVPDGRAWSRHRPAEPASQSPT